MKAGDTEEMIGNLSRDLKAIKKPRLGIVINKNGGYVLVKPIDRHYVVDFLDCEVKPYKP